MNDDELAFLFKKWERSLRKEWAEGINKALIVYKGANRQALFEDWVIGKLAGAFSSVERMSRIERQRNSDGEDKGN